MSKDTLYGTAPSRGARVIWLASELGIELDVKPVNIFGGEHKSPDYNAINILQQVPAFTDEHVSIGESLAITLYLTRKYKGDVCAQSLAEEAQIYQWTMIAAAADAQTAPIMTHKVMLPEDKRDNKAADMALKGLKRTLAGVDRYLATGQDYLVGNRFTVADLNLAGATALLHFVGLSGDVGPAFAAWLARVMERPGAKANIMPPMAPPPQMVERIMQMLAAE